MEKIVFEKLTCMPSIGVDMKKVHEKFSNIYVLELKKGEIHKLKVNEFPMHLAVLTGEITGESKGSETKLSQGCLASLLPNVEYELKAVKNSSLLIIEDNPLWILTERRSVRKYSKIKPPYELVKKVIEKSLYAPSGGNLQPWKIYLTDKPEIKHKMMTASYGQKFVYEAPYLIIITALPKESGKKYGSRGEKLYSIQDTAALATYIMLTAKAFGLDTCWVGAFNEELVKKHLNLPEDERPVVIIPIGYGEEKPSAPPRKPYNEVVIEL